MIHSGCSQMSEYKSAVADIKKTMGVVLDQFKVIPKDVVAPE
jgi:hypothetical protein